mmetsp:Transcript_20503/g.43994  ORF Transcript_20503/g.43994 Transcript_20503/m.43994 type:complete len:283 (+) Transcript_20503:227-1075(+)
MSSNGPRKEDTDVTKCTSGPRAEGKVPLGHLRVPECDQFRGRLPGICPVEVSAARTKEVLSGYCSSSIVSMRPIGGPTHDDGTGVRAAGHGLVAGTLHDSAYAMGSAPMTSQSSSNSFVSELSRTPSVTTPPSSESEGTTATVRSKLATVSTRCNRVPTVFTGVGSPSRSKSSPPSILLPSPSSSSSSSSSASSPVSLSTFDSPVSLSRIESSSGSTKYGLVSAVAPSSKLTSADESCVAVAVTDRAQQRMAALDSITGSDCVKPESINVRAARSETHTACR